MKNGTTLHSLLARLPGRGLFTGPRPGNGPRGCARRVKLLKRMVFRHTYVLAAQEANRE